jgi:predicted CXXCH cytochrome family protein
MKRYYWMISAMVVVGAAILLSCTTINRVVIVPPMIPGATYVGMDQCAVCHEKEVKDFKFTAHARIQIPGEDKRLQGQGCESCHGPGSVHVEAGGGRGNIVNPRKDSAGCFQCHLDKHAEFSLPYHHPVKEGRMSCIDCHDPHGKNIHKSKGVAFTRGLNDTCAKCHREQTSPKLYEHFALREGCTTCHKVHGSINDKMLVERDANLCLKCHGELQSGAGNLRIGGSNHNSRLRQGTCWSAGCHTGIHGSNINPHFRY